MIPVTIIDATTGEHVVANLRYGLTRAEIGAVDQEWRPETFRMVDRLRAARTPSWHMPQHGHWSWQTMTRQASSVVAIEYGGNTQAMMAVKEGISKIEPNDRLYLSGVTFPSDAQMAAAMQEQDLVYIDLLAVAPWNLKAALAILGEIPQYIGLGKVLMDYAIEISIESGYEGRVGLVALPQADPFYRKCGMIELGRECKNQCMAHFEFTSDLAQAYRNL